MDETSLQVLRKPGKAAQSQSTMWLYRSGSDAEHPLVLYEYQPNRKAEHPKRFLEGWRGSLHTDGYAGYHSLSLEITAVGCWAHAWRGFDEALKAIPEKERPRSGALEGKTSAIGSSPSNENSRISRRGAISATAGTGQARA